MINISIYKFSPGRCSGGRNPTPPVGLLRAPAQIFRCLECGLVFHCSQVCFWAAQSPIFDDFCTLYGSLLRAVLSICCSLRLCQHSLSFTPFSCSYCHVPTVLVQVTWQSASSSLACNHVKNLCFLLLFLNGLSVPPTSPLSLLSLVTCCLPPHAPVSHPADILFFMSSERRPLASKTVFSGPFFLFLSKTTPGGSRDLALGSLWVPLGLLHGGPNRANFPPRQFAGSEPVWLPLLPWFRSSRYLLGRLQVTFLRGP